MSSGYRSTLRSAHGRHQEQSRDDDQPATPDHRGAKRKVDDGLSAKDNVEAPQKIELRRHQTHAHNQPCFQAKIEPAV
ncbi:MAG TPA: hypothetical protein VII92_09290, partial [Anaerolineae bacterium]